jgi:ectoine hydroxylase-related dioxygenase (phytanoyl-CoA dioxygenase family)
MELRRAMLEICAAAGWIDGSDRMSERWSGAGPFTEGDPQYMAVYKQIINHPLFIAWPERREFIETIGKIVDGPVLAHRLRIGRVTFPNNVQQTTAAHQDFQYIRGSAQTYTVWTPIGDCPIELGALAVLRGSHRAGFIEHQNFKEKKYAGQGLPDKALPAGEGIEWHAGDFAAGDALIFHSHTIHKAMPNLTKDRLRLSTDNRYQAAGDHIADISTKSHYGL